LITAQLIAGLAFHGIKLKLSALLFIIEIFEIHMKKNWENFHVVFCPVLLAQIVQCLLMFVVVCGHLKNIGKQNIALVRHGLWICLPPYFSVRVITRILFFS